MKQVYTNKAQCCGCTACYAMCPREAIQMLPDSEGFLYPSIDETKCINCGLCQKVCDFNNPTKFNPVSQHLYGYKHENEAVLKKSSSGGAFTAISNEILDRDGAVFGAVYDGTLTVVHAMAEDAEGRDRMCGSKYVQSRIGDTYTKVKEVLEAGRQVLFTGTPCQVAGLRSFLGRKDYPGLTTVDFICHGVPSPQIFKEYLCFVEKKMHKKIVAHECRGKQSGWAHVESNRFADGSEDHVSRFSQLHRRLFYKDIANRPACHNCPYAGTNRVSDITIADFWGVDTQIPEFYDKRGVSLLLINTVKGEQMFRLIKEKGQTVETCLEQVLPRQPLLSHPTQRSDNRDMFWKMYYKKGYEKAIKSVFYHPTHEAAVDTMREMGIFPFIARILGKS